MIKKIHLRRFGLWLAMLFWTSSAFAAEQRASWLVMLYQNADDEILEQDIFIDLNEAELVGSSAQVQIVTQLDRYPKGFKGDGNWKTTKRFHVEQDDELSVIHSKLIKDLGEVNMADGQSLVEFVAWAVENYPAERYALIMSDHGQGWPGGWDDDYPEEADKLYLNELQDALQAIQEETGIEQLDFIGFDACLMSQIEVYAAVAPYARYAVASQEVEPSIGWAYQAFLTKLTKRPKMDGAELAKAIVETYLVNDIVVEQSKKTRWQIGGNSGESDDEEEADEEQEEYLETEEAMTDDLQGVDMTLAAISLEAIPAVIDAFNQLLALLQDEDQEVIAGAKTYTQTFTSVFGDKAPPSYLDLGHFALMLQEETESDEVSAAVDQLMEKLQQAIIAEKHDDNHPGATGISLYFPSSKLYKSKTLSGYASYTEIASQFAEDSLWDDFLRFHYTGKPFSVETSEIATPEEADEITAPGAGELSMTPIALSADTVREGETLGMTTTIHGKNLAFIYVYTGYYDEDANAVRLMDMDFVDAEQTKKILGVYYPDWGKSPDVELEFDWEPMLVMLSDGNDSEYALLYPEDYGATTEKTTYSAEGTYTFYESGESRYALIYFNNDGEMRKVVGFADEDGSGAPREIVPRPGDTFTLFEEWMTYGENDDDEVEFSTEDGATLTFGKESFSWEKVSAPAGQYMVGFIAENFDGTSYDEAEFVTVEE